MRIAAQICVPAALHHIAFYNNVCVAQLALPFDAWGYYLLEQKLARLAIGDDDRSTRFGDDDDYSTQSSEEA